MTTKLFEIQQNGVIVSKAPGSEAMVRSIANMWNKTYNNEHTAGCWMFYVVPAKTTDKE